MGVSELILALTSHSGTPGLKFQKGGAALDTTPGDLESGSLSWLWELGSGHVVPGPGRKAP